MITLAPSLRVYLACGVTDMRKGMIGLAMLVQQSLAENPFDGAVYAFRGRRALGPQRRDPLAICERGTLARCVGHLPEGARPVPISSPPGGPGRASLRTP